MHLRIEPPIDQWPTPTARRPIWTGHQATLFHPGILAKYAVADQVSQAADGTGGAVGAGGGRGGGVPMAQVLVDQDVYDPLTLRVPCRDGGGGARGGGRGGARGGGRLRVATVSLGGNGPASGGGEVGGAGGVAVGMRPPVRAAVVARGLAAWPADAVVQPDVERWMTAFSQAEAESENLATQMDGVLHRLLPGGELSAHPGRPVYGVGTPASTLLQREAPLLDTLLHDAAACARHYNTAVASHPGAGMTPMSREPDRVEVPLWALRWNKPRQRVYVDTADTTPIFITPDGEPLGGDVTLAPRALLMTALLRRADRCALFIHGTGGWAYDRITEQWWHAWQGGKLSPMALVTADMYLDFGDVPSNGPAGLAHAVWHAHHLPHNVDRVLSLDAAHPTVRAKRELLAAMDDDRDRKRRRAAFHLLHRLNAELVEAHPEAMAEAERAVERARIGLANAAIARRRDWSFLLHDADQLAGLRVGGRGPVVGVR